MKPKPTVMRSIDATTKASIFGGTPVAVVTVWLIEHVWLAPGEHLDSTVAVAMGTVGAVVFGELWMTFQRLLRRIANGP